MSEPGSDAASRTAAAAPTTLPPGRYDDAGPRGGGLSGKVIAVLLVALAMALVVAGAFTMYRLTSTPSIQGQEISATVVDDERTDIVLDVTRDDPSTPVYCIVRAQEYNKAEVGRREVYVPPSADKTVRVETSIATTVRAFIADVYGCGEDVPDYLLH